MITPAAGTAGSPVAPVKTCAPAYEHSWRESPPRYTALSVLFFLLFFIQPHDLRVAVWRVVRPLIGDERWFVLVGTVTVHTAIFVTANLLMAAIYYAGHPFFEQFKIQTKPWPWQRSETERAQYFALIKKSIALIALNQYVISPIMIWFSYADQKKFGMSGDIDKVPYWYTSLVHITISMVVEDTLFYWAHRTLHHPLLYGHVHKVHHSYKTSIGLASEYAHPIEFVFSNAIPFSVGPMVCGMHYWTFFMWSLLRVGETVDGHSGYEFPWSPYRLLPFSGSSTAHDFHHSHNIGNYASFFTWWDRWMQTDRAFLRHEAEIERRAAMGEVAQEQRARPQAEEATTVTGESGQTTKSTPVDTTSGPSSATRAASKRRAAPPRAATNESSKESVPS